MMFFVNKDGVSFHFNFKFIPTDPMDKESVLSNVRTWCGTGNKSLHRSMVIELNNAACISTGRTILVAKQPAKNKPISETPELGVKAFN